MYKQILVFSVAALLIVSGLSFAKMLKSEKEVEDVQVTQAPKKEQSRVDEELEELDVKVGGLYPEQKERIWDIIAQGQEEKRKILEEAGKKIDAAKSKIEAEIENFLTEEQKVKFRGDIVIQEQPEEIEDEWLKVFR